MSAYAIATGETTTVEPETFKVRFFDARASRAGKGGVRVAYFTNRAEAEVFAASQRLYAKPAVVETLAPLPADLLAVAVSQ